ncbi:MAG TPA: ATP-grasp domain-containing protein [Gemmataceae bacterium]|nr:ATP-grasp domain-containing protein [Gemmataceae bacterium]
MRIFIYEYTCAAAVEKSAAAVSLRAEGAAMLAAVVEDFQRVPGVDVVTIRGTRLESCPTFKHTDEQAFRTAARQADYSLIIAPEFDGMLLDRCRWVLEEGGRLLGPSPDAVALASDKFAMFRWWNVHDVPTPDTIPLEPAAPARDSLAGAVGSVICKQRDGAGCSFARVIPAADWPKLHDELIALPDRPALIVQPYIRGQDASVAFLIGPNHFFELPPAAQHLQTGENLKYLGGEAPLPPPLAERATRIARRAFANISGLLGFVGVDVVVGDDGRDWAIEINPRLTTSYVGLRALAEFNLAEAMLAIVQGQDPPKWKWRNGTVRFGTDGSVSTCS